MYTREQASSVKQKFWTSFGKYMRPVPSAYSEKINWVNYNTGIKGIAFKMNADKEEAYVRIEISLNEIKLQEQYFNLFLDLQKYISLKTGKHWYFERFYTNENGVNISIITTTLSEINIFKESDWPTLISFLKTNIIALDTFWAEYKIAFEMLGLPK